jgi:hypothetical protein
MDEKPPLQYVGYHRPGLDVDPRKLELLRDAYFKSYWIVAGSIGSALLSRLVLQMLIRAGVGSAWVGFLMALGFIFLVNFLIAYQYASMVAEAKGKGSGDVIFLAVGAALLSPLCFGLFGCWVIQQSVTNELKKYDIRVGLFGLKRADIQDKIDQIRNMSQVPPTAPVFDVQQPVVDTPQEDPRQDQ